MTTAAAGPSVTLAEPALARTRAGVTIGTHWLVDTLAFVIIALMPVFRTRLALDDAQVATLLATGSICSGLVQPIAAWIGDRLDTRVLGSLGLLLGGVCVGSFGYATTFAQLWALQALSQIGIGAYHPVAAAGVGRLAGRKRSLWLALFFLSGMLGGITGNTLAPVWVEAWSPVVGGVPAVEVGLRSLGWLIPLAVLGVVAMVWAIHRVGHRAGDGHERHSTLTRAERRRRWGAVWVLWTGNAMRFTTNYALVTLVVLWAERRAATRAGADAAADTIGLIASGINGPLQAAMQVGMGAAGITAGVVLRSRHEKAALVVVPCLGAVAVALIPVASALDPAGFVVDPAVAVAFAMSALAGMGFGGLIPVTISLAQRLLPHRTGLASGMMMGGAWCVAATGPYLAAWLRDGAGLGLDGAFVGVAGLLLVSGLVSSLLPGRTVREVE